MGCCLSKKNPSQPNNNTPKPLQNDLKITTQKPQINNVASQIELQRKVLGIVELDQNEKNGVVEEEEKKEEEAKEVATTKKDVIQHRKSNDGLVSDSPDPDWNLMGEEEVDAILIRCGRLSNGNGNVGRYSGSKRSFDFDKENDGFGNGGNGEEGSRRRESRGSNRRRTASSRSRERVGEQRSGSKERSGGGQSSGRRVSRSPRRRSESPMSNGNANGSVGSGNRVEKPGKLVSVPATVTSFSSLSTDNSTSGNVNVNVNVNGNGILARRNVGSPWSRSPAKGNQVSGNENGNGRSQSPVKGNQGSANGNARSQSPAKENQVSGNGRSQSTAKGNQVSVSRNGNGGGQQQPVLSRNGSRKKEKSPFRRTPLNEIDMNSLPFQPLADKRPLNKGKEIEESKYGAETVSGKTAAQVAHRRTRSRGAEGYEVTKTNYCRVTDLHTPNHDQLNTTEYETMVTPTELSGTETLKLPLTLGRSRSARRSRDLDINLDALLTPTPTTNYTSLLLQDIQNFHQKKIPNSNSNSDFNCETTPTTFPACLNKAHSILEAVADLNSTTRVDPNKKKVDPFVETEVKVGNNLMEPTLHKYVTVRKRGGDIDDEESSGSNSIVGNGHQNWVSSSSWEPNSSDSTDRWTSRTYSRDDEISPVGFQRHAISDVGGIIEDSGSKFSRSERHLQSAPQQQIGATRSRTVTAAST